MNQSTLSSQITSFSLMALAPGLITYNSVLSDCTKRNLAKSHDNYPWALRSWPSCNEVDLRVGARESSRALTHTEGLLDFVDRHATLPSLLTNVIRLRRLKRLLYLAGGGGSPSSGELRLSSVFVHLQSRRSLLGSRSNMSHHAPFEGK
jgi:hypothetical protein